MSLREPISASADAERGEAPRAPAKPVTQQVHGVELADPYAWLRADNWQEMMRNADALDPEIRAYLEAENAHLDAVLSPTKSLQAKLFEEMKGRIKEDDSSVPAPDGPFAYGVRYLEGAEHPRIVRVPREGGGTEEVLLDADEMAKGEAFFRLGGTDHSPDHALLAYATDTVGSEFYTVHVKHLQSGEDLIDGVPDTGGHVVWANNAKSFFYVRLDQNHRPSRVYRHVLGSGAEQDELVYEDTDPGFFVGIGTTQDRRFIVVASHDHQTSECHLIDANRPEQAPRLLLARQAGHQYSVEHRDGELYLLTNLGTAEDFRIVRAPLDDVDPTNWQEVVTHESGRLILSFAVLARHMVRLERQDGLPRIVVRRFSDGAEHSIGFDEEAYSLALSVGYEYDTDQIRFTYSSMTTPARVYDYDMETRRRVMRKEQAVPSGHDPERYVARRLMAPAPDGEQVPVSLLYAKDTPLDGSAPVLLYGYGAYGIAIPAAFSTNRLSLVDRGFVYAIAHVRGGKDRGYRWYREGRGLSKNNTFVDFIAAGEHLVNEGLTSRGRIVAQGGSAGGMLMGAAANMAPDLFLGIIAEVPFVDVLHTMLDATLPLTPPEWPEWGNPIEDRAAFDYIRAYSPYDNVAAQDYPHVLATGGLADPRVTYWEPAKWVAKLRARRTDRRLTLLKTNMEAGHGGRPGRFDALNEVALSYAFALMVAGKA